MTRHGLVTAGQRVALGPEADDGLRRAVQAAAGEPLTALVGPCDLLLDRLQHVPPVRSFNPVTRGVWVGPEGVLLESAGGSGYTQLWRPCQDPASDGDSSCIRVSSRWAPSAAEKAAAHLLRQRHRALRAQVLLHHPALWAALAVGGLTPLHVSVVKVDGVVVLLAGPGGVGKSSLVADALGRGARAACDNLGASDGHVVHGVVEPLRLPSGTGPGGGAGVRAAHGRREHPWPGRLPSLRPDLVLVVRRNDNACTRVRPVSRERAARALVAGTYSAGELQRFWPLVAHLALAGLGPVHPALEETAEQLTESLPCYELTLGRPGTGPMSMPDGRLSQLLDWELNGTRHRATPIRVPSQTDRKLP